MTREKDSEAYVNNNDPDQPAHLSSLIRVFGSHYLILKCPVIHSVGRKEHTVFDLITTHTPISTVKKFHNLQITASVLFLYFFIKEYVVGTHLNCIDLSMQFK